MESIPGIKNIPSLPNPPNLSLTPCKPYVDAVSHDDLVEAEFCPAHAVANWHPAAQTPSPAKPQYCGRLRPTP